MDGDNGLESGYFVVAVEDLFVSLNGNLIEYGQQAVPFVSKAE